MVSLTKSVACFELSDVIGTSGFSFLSSAASESITMNVLLDSVTRFSSALIAFRSDRLKLTRIEDRPMR